jgi:hypothetical protein
MDEGSVSMVIGSTVLMIAAILVAGLADPQRRGPCQRCTWSSKCSSCARRRSRR